MSENSGENASLDVMCYSTASVLSQDVGDRSYWLYPVQGPRGWACAHTTLFHCQLHAYQAGVYLEWHRMGRLLMGIAFSLPSHYLRLTVNLSPPKFMPSRAGTPTLDFPQTKTVFIASFLCASIQYHTLTLPESMWLGR